jgi:hypothetical protein
MIKLNTGFGDYSADGLAHLGETVVSNLALLPIFATLKPTPAQITAAVGDLQSAMAMKGPGRAQAIAAAFGALADLLGEIATNAPQIAGVTDTQLAEIGLPQAKAPTRATTPPDAPQDLRLDHGAMPGEVTGKCKPVPGNIRVYEGQWTLDPNSGTWSDPETFPNSRSFKFTGLTRGKDVWVRVRARNSVGAGPWSDPATIMVT